MTKYGYADVRFERGERLDMFASKDGVPFQYSLKAGDGLMYVKETDMVVRYTADDTEVNDSLDWLLD